MQTDAASGSWAYAIAPAVAAGPISGEADLDFTAAGTLSGSGALAGTAALAFDPQATGTLTAPAAVPPPHTLVVRAQPIAARFITGFAVIFSAAAALIQPPPVIGAAEYTVGTHRANVAAAQNRSRIWGTPAGLMPVTVVEGDKIKAAEYSVGTKQPRQQSQSWIHGTPPALMPTAFVARPIIVQEQQVGRARAGSALVYGLAIEAEAGAFELSGNATLDFTATATGSRTLQAAGNATLDFTSHGDDPWARRRSRVTRPLDFTATGSLAGSNGRLTGTAALAFTPTATLTGAGALSGTAALAFTPTATLSACRRPVGQRDPRVRPDGDR